MKVISTAPTRISLFGSGTDTEPFASTYGGMCINLAINIRQHITLWENMTVAEYPQGATPAFYYKILEEFGMDYDRWGFKSAFDVDIQTGLGSSASAAVALVGAIAKAKGLEMTRQEIAEKAWDIEVNKLGMFGGRQDQYAASFGGMNIITFRNEVNITPVDRYIADNIANNLLLFDTGLRRTQPKLQENLKTLSVESINALESIKDIALT